MEKLAVIEQNNSCCVWVEMGYEVADRFIEKLGILC